MVQRTEYTFEFVKTDLSREKENTVKRNSLR